MKLVSIIIPVYNRTDKFRSALSSVIAQTHENIEIIVVDDGSLPHAVEYTMRDMLKFQKYDAQKEDNQNILDRIEHIQYIRQENKGAPSARNKGLELVKGEYVIFWDADVVAQPDMLQKMLEVFEKNNEASFVYCNFTLMPLSKKMKGQKFNVEELIPTNGSNGEESKKWDVVCSFYETLGSSGPSRYKVSVNLNDSTVTIKKLSGDITTEPERRFVVTQEDKPKQ